MEIRRSGGDARFVFFSGSGRITGLVSAHALSTAALEMVLEQRGIRPMVPAGRARTIGANLDGGGGGGENAPGESGAELRR